VRTSGTSSACRISGWPRGREIPMKHLTWIVLVAVLGLGCEEKAEAPETQAEETAAEEAPAEEAAEATPAAEEADELATPEDFEEEATQAITADNLEEEVARLEDALGEE
jgi:hypothetical protein